MPDGGGRSPRVSPAFPARAGAGVPARRRRRRPARSAGARRARGRRRRIRRSRAGRRGTPRCRPWRAAGSPRPARCGPPCAGGRRPAASRRGRAAPASTRVTKPPRRARGSARAWRARGRRRGSSIARGSPPCSRTPRRKRSRPAPLAIAASMPAGAVVRDRARRRRAPASRRPGARVSARTSGGPPPRSTSIASRTSSGVADRVAERLIHVGEKRAHRACPSRCPSAISVRASARACARRRHERAAADLDVHAPARRAPRRPSSTGSTTAMSGIDSTVAVDVAQRVEGASAGARRAVWPASTSPAARQHAPELRGRQRRCGSPGIASSLSSVPPVWPSAAPRDHRHGQPARRHQRRQRAARSCRPRRPSSACRPCGPRSPARRARSPECDHRLGPGRRARAWSCRARRSPSAAPTAGSRGCRRPRRRR